MGPRLQFVQFSLHYPPTHDLLRDRLQFFVFADHSHPLTIIFVWSQICSLLTTPVPHMASSVATMFFWRLFLDSQSYCLARALFYLGEKYLVQTTSITFLFPQMNSAVFPCSFSSTHCSPFFWVFLHGGALSLLMFQHGGALFSSRFLCRWRLKIRKDGGVSRQMKIWFFPDLQAVFRSQLVFDPMHLICQFCSEYAV